MFGRSAISSASGRRICHPFPVTACATTRLSGHACAVLFHNGTWSDWRENLRRMPRNRIPDGLLSDTRVAASLVDLCGIDVLDRLPGRWVFFDKDFTELCGDWREWHGMKASNLHFLPVLSDRPSRSRRGWNQPPGFPPSSPAIGSCNGFSLQKQFLLLFR